MGRPRIGVLPLARPTFDVPYAEETAAAASAMLEQLDFELVGPPALLFDPQTTRAALADLQRQSVDLLLVLQVTFADAGMAQAAADAISAPIAFWSFPEPRTGGRLRLNSLCGVNLAAHALGRNGRSYATLHRAADTAIQLNGARGYSKDTVLEWIYRYARQARLVDGASEVHRMVLANDYRNRGTDFWSWGVPASVKRR